MSHKKAARRRDCTSTALDEPLPSFNEGLKLRVRSRHHGPCECALDAFDHDWKWPRVGIASIPQRAQKLRIQHDDAER